jgi:hypothetical protein
MIATRLIAPTMLSVLGRMSRACGHYLLAMLERHATVSPIAGDGEPEDVEARLMIALLCAAYH